MMSYVLKTILIENKNKKWEITSCFFKIATKRKYNNCGGSYIFNTTSKRLEQIDRIITDHTISSKIMERLKGAPIYVANEEDS